MASSAFNLVYQGKGRDIMLRVTEGEDNYFAAHRTPNRWKFNPAGPFKWKVNTAGWVYVAQPAIIRVAGETRFGWKEYRLEKDGSIKETDIQWFTTKDEATQKFHALNASASFKPGDKVKFVAPWIDKNAVYVVDEVGNEFITVHDKEGKSMTERKYRAVAANAKFKIGDRVEFHDPFHGWVKAVVKKLDYGGHPGNIYVEYAGGSGSMPESNLRLANSRAANANIETLVSDLDKGKYDQLNWMPKVVGPGSLYPDGMKFPSGFGYDDEERVRRAWMSGKYASVIVYKGGSKRGELTINSRACNSTNPIVRKALNACVAQNASYSNVLKSILDSVKPYMDKRMKGDTSWRYPMLVITVLRKVCDRAVMSAGRYDGKRPPHRIYDIECEKDKFKFSGNLIVTGLLHTDDPDDVSAFDEYDMTLSLMYVGKALNAAATNADEYVIRKAFTPGKWFLERKAKSIGDAGSRKIFSSEDEARAYAKSNGLTVVNAVAKNWNYKNNYQWFAVREPMSGKCIFAGNDYREDAMDVIKEEKEQTGKTYKLVSRRTLERAGIDPNSADSWIAG